MNVVELGRIRFIDGAMTAGVAWSRCSRSRAAAARCCSAKGIAAPRGSERRLNIGLVEIRSLEQQRLAAKFGERVSGAIDDIQLRGMTLALPEPAKGVERRIRHGCIERNHRDARMLEQFVGPLRRQCARAKRYGFPAP
jgi:hypothetical protein